MDSEIKKVEEISEVEQDDVIYAKITKDNKYKLSTHNKEFEFEVPEFILKNQNLLPVLQKEESEAFRDFFENALITIKKVKVTSVGKKNNI